jgi:ribosomal protein S18 acetylase RimI-like enzyme
MTLRAGGGIELDSIHDRQFIDNHPELITEKLDMTNVGKYQIVIDSVKYICKYSGYNPDECIVTEEIINPSLPKNGKKENNYIYGIYEANTNEPVGWIQYYVECDNKPVVFLGELYIRKEKQQKGYGKAILEHFMGVWKVYGMEKAILNVDLKNWNAIRFWVSNGFNKIEKVLGSDDYSENTFNTLQLCKYID